MLNIFRFRINFFLKQASSKVHHLGTRKICVAWSQYKNTYHRRIISRLGIQIFLMATFPNPQLVLFTNYW